MRSLEESDPWRQEVDGGSGGGGSVFHEDRASFWEAEKVPETDGGDGCPPVLSIHSTMYTYIKSSHGPF